MPLFSIEVQMCATVYVKAKSHEKAIEKTKEFITDQVFEIVGPSVSALGLDDKALPKISLSPAMTGYRIWPDYKVARVSVKT